MPLERIDFITSDNNIRIFGMPRRFDGDFYFFTVGRGDVGHAPSGEVAIRMSGGQFYADHMQSVIQPLSDLWQDHENISPIELPEGYPTTPPPAVSSKALFITNDNGDGAGDRSLLKLAHDSDSQIIYARVLEFGIPSSILKMYPEFKKRGVWVPFSAEHVPEVYKVFSSIYQTLDTPEFRQYSRQRIVRLMAQSEYRLDPECIKYIERFTQLIGPKPMAAELGD